MPSTLFQTSGIVLSRLDHKEVDRWYSVFTPDKGKVEFLARGGHKPLAKLTPHLESPAVVDLLLVKGRYYNTVAGVERAHAYTQIQSDLTRLVLAQNALHLVDIGTRAEEVDPEIYQLLQRWMAFLDGGVELSQTRAAFLLGSFALKLLGHVGYHPELSWCLSCRLAIKPSQYRWHGLKGGVVCTDCTRKDEKQWFTARPMTDEALKLVRFSLLQPFGEHLKPHLRAKDVNGFHEAIESLMISHFPTIPASSLRTACSIC
ncbi:MAG: DNA repair protein RecO [bacterium]|nr:DNA repair protein RecO [bacterium]